MEGYVLVGCGLAQRDGPGELAHLKMAAAQEVEVGEQRGLVVARVMHEATTEHAQRVPVAILEGVDTKHEVGHAKRDYLGREVLTRREGDDFLDELRDARRVCRLVPGSEVFGAEDRSDLRAGKGDAVFRRAPTGLVDELADYWFATCGFVPEGEQVLAGV